MSLKDVYIEKEYRNLKCDIIHEFYIPILQHAVKYKRAVGFFSSSALYEMAVGLTALVKNGGKIELIASPRLTQEDIDEIRLGYRKREEIIENALMRDFPCPNTVQEQKKLNLLANLIAEGVMDIKIAFKIDLNSVGIFHEKIGVMEDFEGNKVAFTGSMNETYSGLLQNYESIDVFCSWKEEDIERVEIKESAFDKLWDNLDPAMEVIEFPKVATEKFDKYKKQTTDEIIAENAIMDEIVKAEFFMIPKDVTLYQYQKDAIAAWEKQSFKGIFDMATGTGKTYTALGALSRLSTINEKLAVIIVCPYQHLVEQWAEDIERFNVHPIIAYSTNVHSKSNWRRLFEDSINAYKVGAINKFCVITTNATFALDDFQQLLEKIRRNLCFAVDEAHNFGADKLSSLLPNNGTFRLALSATVERYRDEKGTSMLFDYFGGKCIEFPLEKAIREGYLTEYYYYPIVVSLSEEELDKYLQLTERIKKLSIFAQNDESKKEDVDKLLIRRARIVAGAKEKIQKLLEVLEPYKNDNHMLVYCGATRYDYEEISDTEDKKQIEIVCKLIGEQLGMRVRKFTSEEDKTERQVIKDTFKDGYDLQVITAIKCLDEGVNIPAIKRAFILASSTNPKEYIQRRGRVLRKAEDKQYAEIYDFVTLPRPLAHVPLCDENTKKSDLSLISREFTRMLDFAKSARNPLDIDNLREQILSAYGAYNIYSEEN